MRRAGRIALTEKTVVVANTIEALLASPPDRDEPVVQLFYRDGGQWGELFRSDGTYWLEIYCAAQTAAVRVQADDLVNGLTEALRELRARLE